MKKLLTFFGQILRKGDVDFISDGNRDAVVQTNVDLSSKQGGVIEGLNVFKSIDNLSVLITPGVFYSTGDFSNSNNLGGGERAKIFTTQSFTGLPQTPPVANQPSYLLVYVKIASSSANPDPTQIQTPVTSKNIQTGENVLTRQYPVGTIVISNPILRSEVNKFNGVPLSLLQVDYIGTNQVSSNATIQAIDASIKRNYLVGGSIDIANKKIVASAIPDGLIEDRMIAVNTIAGDKFKEASINSQAIAPYDGGENIATSGDGIATDHLKAGAVTSAKLNYNDSMSDFNARNYLLNSSFEENSAGIVSWTFTGETGTSASVESNASTTLFGLRSAKMVGGTSVGVAKSLKISQKVDFGGPINGEPVTAYFYARPQNDFNLADAGTTGITGYLEFFNNPTDVTPISGVQFAVYSGTTVSDNNGYIKLETTEPIVVSQDMTSIRAIGFNISGNFGNTVNVDGAFLGLTAQSPKYNVALGEQVAVGLNATNITQGQLDGARLADGAVITSKVRNADGSVTLDSGFGIVGSQIRSGTITGGNIGANTITNANLAAGVSAIPAGAILMFLTRDSSTLSDPVAQGCPTGFRNLTSFYGRFPMGANPLDTSATSPIVNPNSTIGTSAVGNGTTNPPVGNAIAAGSHGHSVNIGGGDVGGGGTSRAFPGVYGTSAEGSHGHSVQIPLVTVIFCEKQ